jgi:hypothetical protein
MAEQRQTYTCAIAGQAVTLSTKAGTESLPNHLGATTIVFNTVANPAPTAFWDTKSEYIVTIQKFTKTV